MFFKSFILLFCLFLSFFFNYLLALYANVSFFNTDFTLKDNKDEQKKREKMKYILKNSYFLFVINCLFQTFLNLIISENFTRIIEETTECFGYEELLPDLKVLITFVFSVVLVFFTEILSRYYAERGFGKATKFNFFFLNITYALSKISALFSQRFTNPSKKTKLFIDNERDAVRFVENLTTENLIERKEADLVKAAFNFDEIKVKKIMMPLKKIIFLNTNMTYEEIQKTYLNHPFTRYPVLDEKKQLASIFNFSFFYLIQLKKPNTEWKKCLTKPVLLSPNLKLSEAFEELQKSNNKIAVIYEKDKIFGIVTLTDLLETLIGKITDERRDN